jgi:hypothetical protein
MRNEKKNVRSERKKRESWRKEDFCKNFHQNFIEKEDDEGQRRREKFFFYHDKKDFFRLLKLINIYGEAKEPFSSFISLVKRNRVFYCVAVVTGVCR